MRAPSDRFARDDAGKEEPHHVSVRDWPDRSSRIGELLPDVDRHREFFLNLASERGLRRLAFLDFSSRELPQPGKFWRTRPPSSENPGRRLDGIDDDRAYDKSRRSHELERASLAEDPSGDTSP